MGELRPFDPSAPFSELPSHSEISNTQRLNRIEEQRQNLLKADKAMKNPDIKWYTKLYSSQLNVSLISGALVGMGLLLINPSIVQSRTKNDKYCIGKPSALILTTVVILTILIVYFGPDMVRALMNLKK